MAGAGAAGKATGAPIGTGEMMMTIGATQEIKARPQAPHPGERVAREIGAQKKVARKVAMG